MTKISFTVEELAEALTRAWTMHDDSWNGVMFTRTLDEAAEAAMILLGYDPRLAPLIGIALEGDEDFHAIRQWTEDPYTFEQIRAESNINREENDQ